MKMLSNEPIDVKLVLGKKYIEDVYDDCSERVKADFEKIVAVNEELFERIPFKVVFTEEDSYESAKEMRRRVIEEGVIYIYSGGIEHPILTPEQNLKGRAVHDVFAHMVCGCPFSFQGELNAYYEQRKHYPKEVWNTLFAEIPMQTAAYYYARKNFNFPQRAISATDTDMYLVEHLKKDYSHNSVLSVDELVKGGVR